MHQPEKTETANTCVSDAYMEDGRAAVAKVKTPEWNSCRSARDCWCRYLATQCEGFSGMRPDWDEASLTDKLKVGSNRKNNSAA